MSKTVIIGGGLAGISAGISILEKTPEADVTIYNMGHHLGGRATSWRKQGYNIDHGFHALFESYNQMLAMLKRAGFDKRNKLVSNKKINVFYEDYDGRIHTVVPDPRAHCAGYPIKMYRKMTGFGIRNGKKLYVNQDIEQYDDMCYTQWAKEFGMDDDITKMRWFRFSQDALFNWPHQVSAYIMIKGLRAIRSQTFYYVNGTYGEDIIQPLVDYYKKMGGKICQES